MGEMLVSLIAYYVQNWPTLQQVTGGIVLGLMPEDYCTWQMMNIQQNNRYLDFIKKIQVYYYCSKCGALPQEYHASSAKNRVAEIKYWWSLILRW